MGLYYMSEELSHHGVKGMKWGVRKEQKLMAKSDKWARREEKAKTRFGKNLASDQRIAYKYAADQQRSINNSKGTKARLRQKYGAEAAERISKMGAEQYAAKAARAKSDKKRARYERAAYNNASVARHYRDVSQHSNSTIKRVKHDLATMGKVPLKNIRTGKATTYGREYAKAVAITVTYNVAATVASQYARG